MDSFKNVPKLLPVLLAVGLLAACSALESAETYCHDQGHVQGSDAFQQCVTSRQAEARYYRSFRRGGGGQGAGG